MNTQRRSLFKELAQSIRQKLVLEVLQLHDRVQDIGPTTQSRKISICYHSLTSTKTAMCQHFAPRSLETAFTHAKLAVDNCFPSE